MTEGEKMIWAAAYSAALMKTFEECAEYGIKPNVPGCAEWASVAVIEARKCRQEIFNGCGEGIELAMLDEMIK